MKKILKYFINGLLTILPIVLAVYIIYKIFGFLDSILGNLLKDVLKEDYIPGIGLITTFVLITVLGWMSTQYVSGKIFSLIDRVLEKTPFVKTIYSVIKDTIHSLFGEKRSFSKVVLIEYPELNLKSVGFVTTEDVSSLSDELADHVAVYIPQTFQIAGFTFLVPKDKVKVLDVKPEDAMKFLLSGGVATK
ncbi:DUF502 domain-containing protein [Fictibacillus norfolkensis]|uniref:DUF502 domain-containing protein n=1 Tax=Fictibacillus norfolkensis TaxID=2762233 RepID=A0ABR8SKW3_9BACL|nr:DUF502 domain-containing protein [Fictibacillus norfolkensis]MBD7964095.1 DUF502 domain-containing protein [Fictibacillus norfolkensis]